MARLWAAGGTGTVREVFEQLRAEREIVYTTVLSTMDNLFRKGLAGCARAGPTATGQPPATRSTARA
ncbi:MAG: BlaI/MecI/CopY family transcriptional regulator [Pseudonocardiaceae bacterium]